MQNHVPVEFHICRPVRRTFFGTALIFFIALHLQCVCAQSTSPLSFEVASVRQADPSIRSMFQVRSVPGQFTATNASLFTLIQEAYGLRPWEFTGPDWLRTEKFNIVARTPPGASDQEIKRMLQSLLAERFGLVTHKEAKNGSVYELRIDKSGLKLKEASELATGSEMHPSGGSISTRGLAVDKDGWPVIPPDANGIALGRSGERTKYIFRKQPINELLKVVSNYVRKPVIDRTGLTRSYDFDLVLEPRRGSQPNDIESGAPSAGGDPAWVMIEGLAAIGLRLTPTEAPFEVLVVDRISRTPSEN